MQITDSEVAVREDRQGPSLVLKGPIEIRLAPQLHRLAQDLAAASGRVRIDWAEATHLSAAALQVLIALESALVSAGGALDAPAPPPALAETLRLAGWQAPVHGADCEGE
jgi:anti-anti-sigma regulatory factor